VLKIYRRKRNGNVIDFVKEYWSLTSSSLFAGAVNADIE
jgi:hypothetical protein